MRAAAPRPVHGVLLALLLLATLALSAPARAGAAAVPTGLSARAWILLQPDTGIVVAQHRADARLPVGSTTKLMTALLTLEHEPLTNVVTEAPYRAQPAESLAGLQGGERLTVADLLRATLLASANEAANTLAVRVGGSLSSFLRAMNDRAQALGLSATHYANPIGLDAAGNYSSAADLVKLSALLLRNPFFARTVALSHAQLTSGAHPRVVVNRNTLVGSVPGVVGVKTGHTQAAGYVLVGAARRHGVTVLSAVLGDPSEAARNADSAKLLRYGLSRFDSPTVVHAGQRLASASLRYRPGHNVDLVAAHSIRVVLARGTRARVSLERAPRRVDGPLAAGATEGAVVVRAGGRILARVPLVTARAVPKATLGERLRDYLRHGATLILLAGVLGCSLLLVVLRRRVVRRREARSMVSGSTPNG